MFDFTEMQSWKKGPNHFIVITECLSMHFWELFVEQTASTEIGPWTEDGHVMEWCSISD